MKFAVGTRSTSTLVVFVGGLLTGCGDGEAHPDSGDASVNARTGAIQIHTSFNYKTCPWLDPLTAVPLETSVGHTIRLVATATDPRDVSTPFKVHWRADNGWTALGTSVQFPCDCAGLFVVAATVSNGDSACDRFETLDSGESSSSIELTCSEPFTAAED